MVLGMFWSSRRLPIFADLAPVESSCSPLVAADRHKCSRCLKMEKSRGWVAQMQNPPTAVAVRGTALQLRIDQLRIPRRGYQGTMVARSPLRSNRHLSHVACPWICFSLSACPTGRVVLPVTKLYWLQGPLIVITPMGPAGPLPCQPTALTS